MQNQKLTMSLPSDIMRFSVLGIRSDIRIKLQAPVDMHALTFMRKWIFNFFVSFFFYIKFCGLFLENYVVHLFYVFCTI